MGILQNEAEYGYFHISNGKKIPSDFVSTALDYIFLDKVSGNHKKADVYSIIKYVSGNSKDITKIESTISEIDNALDTYKSIIEKLKKIR